jgi:hypothetical protein
VQGGHASVGEGEGVGKRLRHRLDGELRVGVSGGVDRAVDRGDTDAEPVGIGCGQLGDVVGYRTAIGAAGVEHLEQVVRDRGAHAVSVGEPVSAGSA